MKKSVLIGVFFVLNLCNVLSAQVTLSFGSPYVANGNLRVPLVAHGFTDVVSAQFSIGYLPSTIHINTIVNPYPSLNISASSNFNFNHPNRLVCVWFSQTALPVSVPDGSTLYELQFDGVPTNIENLFMEITNYPVPIEIVQFASTLLDVYTIPLNSTWGTVRGQVFHDENNNCIKESTEAPLNDALVLAINGVDTLYSRSDTAGNYIIFAPIGTYALQAQPYGAMWGACAAINNVQIGTPNQIVTHNVGLQSIYDCPLMEVNLTTPFLRRCFSNTYVLDYCNKGTTTAEAAYVDVFLDPYLAFENSSRPYTVVSPQQYRFALNDVAVGECGQFYFTAYLNCDATVLGQTHCTEAYIYPNTGCGEFTGWDGSSLRISGVCEGDSVRFELKNVGDNDMSTPRTYYVIEDDMILYSSPIQLNAGDSHEVAVAGTGHTYRVQADPIANHPFGVLPGATVEGCTENATFTTGFFGMYAPNDQLPNYDSDCQESIGSFDPNDKQGFPRGYQDEHYILPTTPLEYLIRFQNTGTDTAFTVMISDTISPLLDMRTLRPLASSHPYQVRFKDSHIVQFVYDNIALPDSHVNEAASHGFIRFAIQQKANNALGLRIENQAAIYFDFNAPVLTNTTFHTLGEDFIPVNVTTLTPSRIAFAIAPHPVAQTAQLHIFEDATTTYEFVLYDLLGGVVRRNAFSGKQYIFERGTLSSGVYIYHIKDRQGKWAKGKLVIQ